MDEYQINVLYEQLVSLIGQGKEDAARTLLGSAFPQLPEDTQREIALATFIDLMDKESTKVIVDKEE